MPVFSHPTYEELEASFTDWANLRPDVQAVVVVGSRARTDHPADGWSDLDLVAFVDDPRAYLESGEWLGGLGTVILAVSDIHANGNPEWIAVYAGGAKLDVVFVPAGDARGAAALIAGPMYRDVFARGVRVLLDRADPKSAGQTIAAEPSPTAVPTQEELHNLLNELWLDALRAAKFTRRGDLWRAAQGIMPGLRARLLTLAEWQAHAVRGPDRDVWYDGRHLEEWADERVIAALPDLFPAWNEESLVHSLDALLDCTHWLGVEIAEACGFPFPSETESTIRSLMP